MHARGARLLRRGRHAEAIASFERALELYPEHAQSHLGLALALRSTGSRSEAESVLRRLPGIIEKLAGARPIEAALVEAERLATAGDPAAATARVCRLLESAPPGFAAWTVPIEPFLHELRGTREFAAVLARLAERAS